LSKKILKSKIFIEVECPSKSAVYKELRTMAMKFLGKRMVKFEDAKDAAAELYASIAGDVEDVSRFCLFYNLHTSIYDIGEVDFL
jgi:hypothetical protein